MPAPERQLLKTPFVYRYELKKPTRLRLSRKAGKRVAVQTKSLSVRLATEKLVAKIDGQTVKLDHLVLKVKNRTPKHLAYRVVTEIASPQKCLDKGSVDQNAIVMRPGEEITRTECIFRGQTSVLVRDIQVVEIPAFSAAYLSRVHPSQLLYDDRTSDGHTGTHRDTHLPSDGFLA